MAGLAPRVGSDASVSAQAALCRAPFKGEAREVWVGAEESESHKTIVSVNFQPTTRQP